MKVRGGVDLATEAWALVEDYYWDCLRTFAHALEAGQILNFRQVWDARGRLSVETQYAGAVSQISIIGGLK